MPRELAQNFNSLRQKLEARNFPQERYLQAIENNTVTFGVGPAGTGKTLLAIYQAICHMWAKKQTGITKLVLTRPAIEAGGEKIGFLPGAIEEKLDPYMRPFYDSLHYIVGPEVYKEKIAKGHIEIAPVAFMRGRTFNNSFIVLDEAQNCSREQLKMVLTRLGDNVKLVICGDETQSDLRGASGLRQMVEALSSTADIGIVRFSNKEVVRSEIVRNVLEALERYEQREIS